MSASNPESIQAASKVVSSVSSQLSKITPKISVSLLEEMDKEQKERHKSEKQ